MSRRVHLAILTAMLFLLPAIEPAKSRAARATLPQAPAQPAPPAKGMLIEARNLAYDANYRNDQAGLRAAIAAIEPLVKDPELEAYAHYYLSWTYWSLTASQIDAKDMTAALESANRAVTHARASVTRRGRDADFQTMLANALIAAGIVDRERFKEIWAELATVRKRAVELGAANPRTVMMDAGMIYWAPPEQGGGRDKGVARWEEAERLFAREADEASVNPLAPRWGQALYYGWAASLYLNTTPPQRARAQRAIDTALAMRPDFWYVRERLLPKLRE
jgi:hypothetical protein